MMDAETRARKLHHQRELSAIKKAERREHLASRPAKVATGGEGQRKPRVREPLYLAFIRRQACAAAGAGGCGGPIEAAHVRYSDASRGRTNPGMQQKPDDQYTLPLCRSHHTAGTNAQHSMNERKFWEMVGADPAILMASFRKAYEARNV